MYWFLILGTFGLAYDPFNHNMGPACRFHLVFAVFIILSFLCHVGPLGFFVLSLHQVDGLFVVLLFLWLPVNVSLCPTVMLFCQHVLLMTHFGVLFIIWILLRLIFFFFSVSVTGTLLFNFSIFIHFPFNGSLIIILSCFDHCFHMLWWRQDFSYAPFFRLI